MTDLEIRKINDVYLHIDCEKSIARHLYEHFSFSVPGAHFMKSYKVGRWDGYYHLFDPNTYTLYAGLLPRLEEFIEENDYDAIIDREVYHRSIPNITPEQTKTLVDKLYITSKGEHLKPLDYQLYAIYKALTEERRLFLSATSSGKSFIIYAIFRLLQYTTNKKILIVVPNTTLINQLYNDFQDYSNEVSWQAKNNIHVIKEGAEKHTKKQIVLSTWQSIYEQDENYLSDFKAILIDEAHTVRGPSLQTLLEKLTNCPFRFGFTGTLDNTEANQLMIEAMLGKTLTVSRTKNLIDRNLVSKLYIKVPMLCYPSSHAQHVSKFSYQNEIDLLIQNEKRNNFIVNLAISQKRNTLILFDRQEHGKQLYHLTKEKIHSSRNVYMIYGDINGDEREKIRNIMENEEDAILIASYGTLSVGVNIRNLHSIIFAHPFKSCIRIFQSIGRGIRLHPDKEKLVLYDIADNYKNGSDINHTLKHFYERKSLYENEGFPYSIYKIPFYQ